MNIAFCLDLNFSEYCSVAIQSIINNHASKNKITFYILSFFRNKKINIIKNQIKNLGHNSVDLYIDKSKFNNFQIHSHFSEANYLRLFLSELLPLNVERILYLDCDLIVLSDLTSLYNEDLKKYSTAMVPDIPESYKYNHLYFNSGVMLINIDAWRKKAISKKIINYINSFEGKLDFLDQDAINQTIANDVKVLNINWNMITQYFSNDIEKYSKKEKNLILKAKERVNIVHFTSASKPLNYLFKHPYKQIFLNYLKETPFKNTRKRNKTLKTILKKLRIYIRKKLN